VLIIGFSIQSNKDRGDETQMNATKFKKVVIQVASFANRLEEEVTAAQIGRLQTQLNQYVCLAPGS
jgi:hypothetical protein